mgnify:CR=1 FL=1|jgi:type I restriction enzyme S subunit
MAWITKKLGEICEEIISGDWGTEREKTGSVLCKVIRGTDFILAQKGKLSEFPDRYIDIEKFEKIKLKQGDILVEISGGSKDQPTGRILFWDRNETIPIAFSNFVKKILLNTEIVEPKFFFRYWQFLYFKGITKNYEDRTTNIRNFKLKEFLENEEIPIPPLPIQQKIVQILDTIQSAVEIQEKIIEKTKELKRAVTVELFKYGAPSFRKGRKLKKTEIGEIPEDWEVVRLGDKKKGEPLILTLRNGLTYKQHELQESGIPITRIETIADGKIDFKKIGYLKNIDQNLLEKYKLKKGDILFSHINSEIHLGKTAIYLEDEKFILHGMNLLLIRPNSKFIDSKFLNYLFNWYKDNGIFISIASRAVNQASINQNTLKNLKLPLPPLPEQQEIAEILQTIDQKIEIEKKKKELYEELFKTMLNKIMNQEIDVEKLEV